jgi:hypothetical protein
MISLIIIFTGFATFLVFIAVEIVQSPYNKRRTKP